MELFVILFIVQGLSPRVRGNLLRWRTAVRLPRSIPACAGEPAYRLRHPNGSAVYPRVCGGTGTGGWCGRTVLGLSPRVRGNPST